MLRDLRHRVEYAGFVGLHGLIRLLPHRSMSTLGGALGAASLRFGKRRRLLLGNLEMAFPEREPDELREIARRCARSIGTTFFEEVSATRFDPAEFSRRFEVAGWHHIEELERAGQAFLIIGGHLGPFDFVGYPVAQRLGPIHIVVQERSNPYTRARMNEMQEHIGLRLIPRGRAGAKLLTLLRQGEHPGLAIDQRVRPWDGILIPFLGRYCWSSPVPAFLCQRTKAPAVPVCCERLEDGRYRLLVREPIWPADLGQDPIYELTCRHHRAVEREIRRAPEHWFWIHDRWRLTWKHSYPKSMERLRRESGLPEDLDATGAARDQESASAEVEQQARTIDGWVSSELLEATANLALVGVDEVRRREVAMEIVRRVVDRGYAARFLRVEELAESLGRAESNGTQSLELRKLDPFALLVLDGGIEAEERRARVIEALRHRRPRGSVLLSTARLEDSVAGELRPRHQLEL